METKPQPLGVSAVDKTVALFSQAKADRGGLDQYWKQLYKFAQPEKDDVTGMRNPAERLATDVYDDTAINAIAISSAGLHGYLTNPAQRVKRGQYILQNKTNFAPA